MIMIKTSQTKTTRKIKDYLNTTVKYSNLAAHGVSVEKSLKAT